MKREEENGYHFNHFNHLIAPCFVFILPPFFFMEGIIHSFFHL